MKTNINAFKKLIKRYESITLKEIENAEKILIDKRQSFCGEVIAAYLTGFGEKSSCTLCKSVSSNCEHCLHYKYNPTPTSIWFRGYSCMYKMSEKTYDTIYKAETSLALLKAFRSRAKYMRRVLKKLGYTQP